MASGAAFHRAYPRATQQAFLEAHEGAFQYFGGTFATLRYDNLSSAVRKILRGFRRELVRSGRLVSNAVWRRGGYSCGARTAHTGRRASTCPSWNVEV